LPDALGDQSDYFVAQSGRFVAYPGSPATLRRMAILELKHSAGPDAMNEQLPIAVLYRGNHICVERQVRGAESVIVKFALEGAPEETHVRLRNEARILQRLSGEPCVPALVEFDAMRMQIQMRDDGMVPLAQSSLPGKADLRAFLTLALNLAQAVQRVHGHHVIHKDINPANLLVDPATLAVQLIDFGLSTSLSEEHTAFAATGDIPGTLAYLAPEQSGRMNRPVDMRADLYSVGCTLYTLATGQPPFQETDTLGLIHAHLARAPLSAQRLASWLPTSLAALIATLLHKEPDARYQSASGLVHDLRAFLEALGAGQPLDALPLRQHDLPAEPRAPRRLHGRDRELATLVSALQQISMGGVFGVFVAGPPGIGKTGLIQELHRPLTLRGGLYASGKFEQFHDDDPFLAVRQVLAQLSQLLLADMGGQLAQQRQQLMRGLGADAAALVQVVPELGPLLPPGLPAPAVLDKLQAQHRIWRLVQRFIGALAAPGRPLVIFLDDVQWADGAALRFLTSLLLADDIHGLLVVAAYRDGQLDPAHGLHSVLRQAQAKARVQEPLVLKGLGEDDLAALLADMLHMPVDQLRVMAALLARKTGGNPFHTVAYVNALHGQGLLQADAARGRWVWDEAQILAHPATDNVLDFLAARLAALAPQTSALLFDLACMGSDTQVQDLAMVNSSSPEQITQWLVPAFEAGVLITDSARIRFCHDKMLQAVYESHGVGEHEKAHLRLARCFARERPVNARAELRAARHYSHSVARLRELAPAASERIRACELFLLAAQRARGTGSYQAAKRFLSLAKELLGLDAFSGRHAELALAIHEELHIALYSLALHADADAIYAILATQGLDSVRLVSAAGVQIASLSMRRMHGKATALGIELLRQLGVQVPARDISVALREQADSLYAELERGALQRIESSEQVVDGHNHLVVRLVSRLASAAFRYEPRLAYWLALHVAQTWFAHGYCPEMLVPTVNAMRALVHIRGDYGTGWRIARTALRIGEQRGAGLELARAQSIYALFEGQWFEPLQDCVAMARHAFDTALAAGDLEFAGVNFTMTVSAALDSAPHLQQLHEEVQHAVAFTQRSGSVHNAHIALAFGELVRVLGGLGTAGSADAAEPFDEAVYLRAIRGNAQPLWFYHAIRAVAALILGDSAALGTHARAAQRLARFGQNYYLESHVALAQCLYLSDEANVPARRDSALAQLQPLVTWFSERAADAPVNFGHLFALMEAELHAMHGRHWAAMQSFEQALSLAQTRRCLWHLALISERAGAFCARSGLHAAARQFMLRATGLYGKWGASAKVARLSQALGLSQQPGTGGGTRTPVTGLDTLALLRATQSLAGASDLDALVQKAVNLLAQTTGATGVALLIADEREQWFLEGGLQDGTTLPRMPLSEALTEERVAASVMRVCMATQREVAVDDATSDVRFSSDPYFKGMGACSALAVPLFIRDKLGAVVLLVNSLTPGAFAPSLVQSVVLLGGHLAMAVDSLRMHTFLERTVRERTRDVAELLSLQRSAIDNSPIGIAVYDADGQCLHVNAAYASIVGGTPQHLLAQNFRHLQPWHDSGSYARALAVLETGETSRELVHLNTMFGKNIWVDWILSRFTSGGQARLLSMFQDVTEQVRAQEALRAQGERLQTILDAAPVGVAIASRGVVRFTNPRMTQMLGVQVGSSVDPLALDATDGPMGAAQLLIPSDMASTSAAREREVRLQDPSGSLLYGLATSLIIEHEGHDAVLTWLVDVTKMEEAKEAMRRARDLAESATQMKSGFLANMSHEIRTPLNAILGMAQLCLQGDLSARQRDYTLKIHRAGQHLLHLINDILDFSKIEADKLGLEQLEFRLEALLERVSSLTMFKAQDKGLELLIAVAPGTPIALVGDEMRLGQVLLNLLNNAIKFTSRGEVVLSVRCVQQSEQEVVLGFEVRDTGIGISEEQRAKLFEAFVQADASTTRHYGGTGLGLSISQRLVHMMNGTIDVKSTPGEGSSFSFTVPLGLRSAVRPQWETDFHRLRPARVLVVDDNITACHILCSMLQAFGLRVHGVDSGRACIAELRAAHRRRQPYKILFLDWQMPEMDGLQTAREIRADLTLSAGLPIVLVTAHNRDELMAQADALDICAVLEKPVHPSMVLEAISHHLGNAPHRTGVPPLSRSGSGAASNPSQHAPLAGVHVLLVEDNDINQEVACEFLRRAAATVDVAGDGAQALERLKRQAYDVVLMDWHMPVMDGVQATQRIRQDATFAKLPIIAMTANAMTGDREKCLAIGMNDYIMKPIDAQQLVALVAQWARKSAVDAPAEPLPPVRNQVAADVLPNPPEGIDVLAAIKRLGNNTTLYRKLLSSFLGKHADDLQMIARLLDTQRQDDAQRYTHTLKGLLGNLGAMVLMKQLGAVEAAVRDKAPDAKAQLLSLQAPFESVVAWLREVVAQDADAVHPKSARDVPGDASATSSEPVPVHVPVEVQARFRTLLQLIQKDDAGALGLAQDMAEEVSAMPGMQQFGKVLQYLRQYDYDAAGACLVALLDPSVSSD
jgi:PAS domain S-box-containing protein